MFKRPHTETLDVHARLLFVSLVVHACPVPSCPCFATITLKSFKDFSDEALGMSYAKARQSLSDLELHGWVQIMEKPGMGRWGQTTINIPKLVNGDQLIRRGGKQKNQSATTKHFENQSAMSERQSATTKHQSATPERQSALSEHFDWAKLAGTKKL